MWKPQGEGGGSAGDGKKIGRLGRELVWRGVTVLHGLQNRLV